MQRGEPAKAQTAISPAEALIAFVRNAPMGVAITDRELKYLAASPAWLKQWRLTEADLAGRDCFEFAPELRPEIDALHARALAGELDDAAPEAGLGEDGQPRWMTWNAGPWRDEAG